MRVEENAGMNRQEKNGCSFSDNLGKKIWAIVIVMLIALGIAGKYAFFTPDTYAVSNIIAINKQSIMFPSEQSLELINTAELKSIINSLNELTPEQAARDLGVDKKTTSSIRYIKANDIPGTTSLKIQIDTLDRDAGRRYMEALPRYVLSRPSIEDRIETQKNLLLKSRDELKRIMDDPLKSLNMRREFLVMVSPTDMYSSWVKYNLICSGIDLIEQGKIIVLVAPTQFPDRPYKPMRSRIMLMGLFGGLLLGLILVSINGWFQSAE